MVTKKTKQLGPNQLEQKILRTIFDIKSTNINLIAKETGIAKSTIHNRMKRMRSSELLKGIMPLIDIKYIQKQITAVSLIKARYGPEYAEEIGKKIANIVGIWAVFFVLGSNDFILLIRAKDKEELEHILNEITKTEGVERSETIMVIKLLKEDFSESLKLIV